MAVPESLLAVAPSTDIMKEVLCTLRMRIEVGSGPLVALLQLKRVEKREPRALDKKRKSVR